MTARSKAPQAPGEFRAWCESLPSRGVRWDVFAARVLDVQPGHVRLLAAGSSVPSLYLASRIETLGGPRASTWTTVGAPAPKLALALRMRELAR